MTTTSAGMLWFEDDTGLAREVLNDERTRHYQLAHPLWTGQECVECSCPILNYNPSTGAPLVYGATPADAGTAPWYDPARPDSAEFLGFVVDQIFGLDYDHWGRTVNQRAGDGANLTPLRGGGREINFRLIATALSDCGMRWGLDWLAHELFSLADRCSVNPVLMRTCCPSVADPDAPTDDEFTLGLIELRDVGVLKAPTYTDRWLDDHGCMVREVLFTLIATDPCMYKDRQLCGEGVGDWSALMPLPSTICETGGVQNWFCGPIDGSLLPEDVTIPQECCAPAPTSSLSALAALVTIIGPAGPGESAGPFEISLWGSMTADVDCDAFNVFDPDAGLMTKITSLGIYGPGADEAVLVDAAAGRVYKRQINVLPLPAWEAAPEQLISTLFPEFPISDGALSWAVVIRPLRFCGEYDSFSWSIETVAVEGCATEPAELPAAAV